MTPDEVRDLESSMAEIWALAQKMGLDPYPTHFELVPASIMYEFGAYGIPGRFSHWTHGRAYQQIKTMYDYGLSKIYELVINTNPAYAFLLENNTVLQNKLVAAHVLAHVDFFKNNAYFQHTNRGMLEATSVNAERLRQYEFEHGRDEVERVLDAVLSIQEHVDANPTLRARPASDDVRPRAREPREGPFDDLVYIGSNRRPEVPAPERKFPPEPEKDLLLFIAEHAPDLEPWERDIVHIVRSEQIYFLPQMQTKVMNEGWASFWHARIMREMDLPQDDYVEFARLHSGVLAASRRSINPYYVGMKIFEDIERRWDQPTDEDRARLGRLGGEGRAKIFEVRELDNDQSFLRNYLTKDLVEELDLYLYRLEDDTWVIVEKDWEVVRDTILTSLTNFGQPYIVVEDGDHHRNRGLRLKHCFEGQELDLGYADKTLRHVQRLWGRSVHLETVIDGRPMTLVVDDERSLTVMTPR
ncbi:MAG: SpoVR family protein [Chloroflexi bacterium]|nr:SpoVR family protein [Chloroflexota bacterium]